MKLLGIALAGVIWPLIHLLVFFFRFGELPPLPELLHFVPTGLFGAWLLVRLLGRAESPGQARWTGVGAALGVPPALIGNVLGGLAGPIGVTVFGLVPLAVGALGGWWIGKRASA